ncbi:MAG: RNA-binding transcriptional accessory protein [Ruminococcaceae bacterium]|nr:RNA-binding transcriptional accessory protein [Oscillospiraceae bacterium]
MDLIVKILMEEFSLKEFQVVNTIRLIDEGNTIPFIARYRKEVTGELSDEILRNLSERLEYLRNLEAKKEEVTRLIDEQEKLTSELQAAITAAKTMTELEDIYRPYRPKRRTRAIIAKEKGLEPLAVLLMEQNPDTNPESAALDYIDVEKGVETTEEALAGAMDIIAEQISDDADYRKRIRELTWRNSNLVSKAAKDEDSVYSQYYEFAEAVSKVANHRILAINRGEKEGFLSVKLELSEELILDYLTKKVCKKNPTPATEYVRLAAEDGYKRLIAPSIETEIRNLLTEQAGEAAIKVFAKNLSGLLLQPPVKGRTVLGLDPGYRTGCKVAVVDETGKVLDTGIVYCTLPNHDTEKSKAILKRLIKKHGVNLISIGNGTASKETEKVVAELIKEIEEKVYYMVVSEAGASVYSASKLATEEFPEFDVALRSAVSIARRLQDPLAELVKIDPKAIGVGQYQHDMNQKRLGEALGGVVEDCVNSVGVDLNTASPSLLSYISGINASVAKNIAVYREENGKFKNRKQLLKVAKLGQKAFEQCAGFLRITDGDNVLDNTSVHPESYDAAKALLEILGYTTDDVANGTLTDLKNRFQKEDHEKLSGMLGIGIPTIRDIVDSLLKKGRDPREELPQPVLMSDVMDLKDLKPDMVLTGTVRNVIDFGAFVDIGVHQDGLVHVSQICNRYIKHPMDVLSVGDIVKVKVLEVDVAKKRISLTMKDVN